MKHEQQPLILKVDFLKGLWSYLATNFYIISSMIQKVKIKLCKCCNPSSSFDILNFHNNK